MDLCSISMNTRFKELRGYVRSRTMGHATAVFSWLRTLDIFGDSDCLFARGSCVRGDYCRYSDVDLVLLRAGGAPSTDETCARRSQLAKIIPSVCIQGWGTDELPSREKTLTLWLAASQKAYVVGDRALLSQCHERWARHLASKSISGITQLYVIDPRQNMGYFDSQSFYRWNVKRGAGGILDFDYACLVAWWMKVRKILNVQSVDCINKSKMAFDYLHVLKWQLQRIFDCPRENAASLFDSSNLHFAGVDADLFSKEAIRQVMSEHSASIDLLVKSLRES